MTTTYKMGFTVISKLEKGSGPLQNGNAKILTGLVWTRRFVLAKGDSLAEKGAV